MLDITMTPDISARLTPHVSTIICHHIKDKINRKKKDTNKHRGLGQNLC